MKELLKYSRNIKLRIEKIDNKFRYFLLFFILMIINIKLIR